MKESILDRNMNQKQDKEAIPETSFEVVVQAKQKNKSTEHCRGSNMDYAHSIFLYHELDGSRSTRNFLQNSLSGLCAMIEE